MIRKLLFLLAAILTSVGTWAQSAEFVSSSDGTTLTIKASGDLTTNPTTSYVSGYKFTEAAVNHVYTSPGSLTSNSVAKDAAYDMSSSTTYYLADYSYTQIFDGGAPVEGTYAYNVSGNSYTINPSSMVFVSTDGGNTKTQLESGKALTYTEGETFYVASAEFTQISDKTAFRTANPTYFAEVTTSTDFLTALKAVINAGSYTKIAFNNTANTELTINPTIALAILAPTGNASTTLTDLDLGEATITSFTDVFNGNIGVTSLATLTLPLLHGSTTLPSFLGQGYTWDGYHLRTVNVPVGYTIIGTSAFANGSKLTSITIPEGITEIGTSAFEGCMAISTITLPTTLVTIGKCAFKSCYYDKTSGISSINFPSSLREILAEAFEGDLFLTTFKLNNGLEFIGNSAFALPSAVSDMQTLDIPASVKYIGPAAFHFRQFKDVYFYSETAPLCPRGKALYSSLGYVSAFDDNLHMGNNGFNPCSGTGTSGSVADDISTGYANRENYTNGGSYITMLHYPKDLSTDNAKTYTDVTRVYEYWINEATGSYSSSWPVKNLGFNETSTLSFGGVSAGTVVSAGYQDTYRGLNYIWPSQGQWMRSFVVNSCGYEWNGVTEYRPTISSDMIALMVKDELTIQSAANEEVLISTEETIELTAEEAAAYNATLSGAWNSTTEKTAAVYYTQEECDAANAELEGAIKAGDDLYYTTDEINEHNAGLEGAISTSDIKEPAVEAQAAVYYTNDELTWVDNVSYVTSTLIYHEKVDPVYYTDDEIALANGQYYLKDDVLSLDGYYSDAYLSSLGIPNYNYLYSGDTKTDDDGTTLYKYKGTVAKSGATALGWQNQAPFVKTAGSEAYYEVTSESVQASTNDIKTPAVEAKDAVYYTQAECNDYNATLEGAYTSTTVKGTATAETAAAYNASLPGAISTSTVKTAATYYTDTEILEHNADLAGAKAEGDKISNAQEYADDISMLAYMGTRQFVFDGADHEAQGENETVPTYPIAMTSGHHWWTLCVPFNMTKKQVYETFGNKNEDEAPHVCLFSGVERNTTEGSKQIKLKFQHDVYAHKTVKNEETGAYSSTFDTSAAEPDDDDIVIYAHEAYMIYPTATPVDAAFVVNGYEPVTGSPLPTFVTASDGTEYRYVGNYTENVTTVNRDNDGQVIGATVSTMKVPAYSWVYATDGTIKNGQKVYKFWFVDDATMTWKPNKCVVESTAKDGGANDAEAFFDITDDNQSKFITILGDLEEDSEATGVEKVTIIAGEDTISNVVYNLNGQIVSNNGLRGLSKGIYIMNGKKYTVR